MHAYLASEQWFFPGHLLCQEESRDSCKHAVLRETDFPSRPFYKPRMEPGRRPPEELQAVAVLVSREPSRRRTGCRRKRSAVLPSASKRLTSSRPKADAAALATSSLPICDSSVLHGLRHLRHPETHAKYPLHAWLTCCIPKSDTSPPLDRPWVHR